jgi:guanylate kinase
MLVILSGSSGVGKNTIINEMIKRYDEFELLPTFTTREKREGESEGHPYFFVTENIFKEMIQRNELFEHQAVHNNYYGVSKKELLSRARSPKILIKDIDVLGTLNLVNGIQDEMRVLAFFYYVDSKDILVERLKQRKEKNIALRMERYDMEMKFAVRYDYLINNFEAEATIRDTKTVIDFEMNSNSPLPTKAASEIDSGKVNDMAEKLHEGMIFPCITVALKNEKIYIIDGHHRYMASVLAGKRIAKKIVPSSQLPLQTPL